MYKENYPSVLLEEAVDAISSLPGVGRKGALRLALHLLKQPVENVHHLSSAIDRLRDEVHYCSECSMIADGDICTVCSDRSRDHNTICVVETVRDVMSIENTGQYRGVYHVLGGKISPIDGVVKSLAGTESQVEVIFALSGGVEGETTAFYIYRQLSCLGIRVSSIARGLGFGDELEYADELTLGRSIVNRQEFHP